MTGPSCEMRFSKASARYHDAANLQCRIAQELAIKMKCVRGRVLDLGCGTGFLTHAVSRFVGVNEICALDLSPAMIEAARKRDHALRVRWLVSDAITVDGIGRFDWVISSSAFQWMQPLEVLFTHIAQRLLSADGGMFFSLMVSGTLRELHEARLVVAPEKKVRRLLPTVEDVAIALGQAGFEILTEERRDYFERYRDARTFLRVIHDLGFTGGGLSRGASILSRGEISRLETVYDERFRAEAGGVYATFRSLTVEAKLREPQKEGGVNDQVFE